MEQLCSAMSLLLENHFKKESVLSSPEMTRSYLMSKLANYEQEVFSCIYLDNRHQVIEYEELFFGTIDGASVYPREVVKRCLYHNAAAVIFAHNHPSGVAEPSQADERITIRLKESLALVDIRVLDHIIIGGADTVSLAERGLL
jgi:DNA repair protein RadC